MAKTTTKKKKTIKAPVKTIDQLTFARIIAQKYELPINTVLNIILEEQKLTMMYVSRGYKVIKKNYITIKPAVQHPRKFVCPINKKEYDKINNYIKFTGDGFHHRPFFNQVTNYFSNLELLVQ